METIGRGGMGVVFRARDTKLGRDVALKCPWPHMSKDAVARHRFLREARATSRLAHPTIVPVYEVFEDRELPWIAMELVEGRRTLAESLVDGEPLPLDQILQHAEDLTDALRAAHTKGILHRDIKPSNVLVGTDGRVRLTDFGLARFIATADRSPEAPTDGASDVTEEGKVVGTIAYMAPEVLLGGVADPRSDLFSLGVIVYEMCTGRAAFLASSKYDVYELVLRREPPAIGRFNYEIPRSLERIVRKALAKRPDERYQDARDMLADVRTIRRRITSGSYDLEDELDIGRPKRRWLTWTLAGVAAASLSGAAWLASRPAAEYQFPFHPRQLTSAPGIETEPAISPDGTLVAYAAEDRGQYDVWLVKTAGGNPIRLTDDPASDRSPAWYPDGAAIAFVSNRGGADAVWKVPALGGSATLIVANATDPAISPEGRRIAFARNAPSGTPRIFASPIDAPERANALTDVDVAGWGHAQPAWSPDGRSIAFADFNTIWVVPASGGPARQVTRGEHNDKRPAWSSDGRSITFTSDGRDSTRALWRIDADGRNLKRLTAGSGPERLAGGDKRGTLLVYTTAASDSDIGLQDLVTGSFSRFGAQRRDYAPALSPDGKHVLFTSERWGGGSTLAEQDLNGVQPLGTTRRFMERPVAVARYSPDGKWIAFWRVTDGQRDVWIVPADGGEEVRFDDDPADDLQPAFSPVGDRLAFVSARSGRPQVWIGGVAQGRSVGKARRLTVSDAVDGWPEWSPDGSQIAFLRSDRSSDDVWLIAADGTSERRLTTGAHAMQIRWPAASDELFVSGTWGTGNFEIRSVLLRTGESRPLSPPAVGTSDLVTALFDVARGGRLLATTIAESRGDIWILQGPPGSF
jgi:Tol biopolymer transport system component/serine/threonine protein kinase